MNDLPLHWACTNGHLDIIKELIAADVNADIHADDDWALRRASAHSQLEIIKQLIKNSGDKSLALANIKDKLVKKQIGEFNPTI